MHDFRSSREFIRRLSSCIFYFLVIITRHSLLLLLLERRAKKFAMYSFPFLFNVRRLFHHPFNRSLIIVLSEKADFLFFSDRNGIAGWINKEFKDSYFLYRA